MRQYLGSALAALAALFLAAMPLARAAEAPPRCSVEQTTFKGWKAYRLTNGLVTLTIAPEIAGRAIQFELGSHAYFFVNPELAGKVLSREQNDRGRVWANYGGDKDWLGPQGFDTAEQWAGPPDYNLDGSRFAAEVVANNAGEVAVRVTSPPDDRSGLQLSRTYHLERGATRVRIEHRMKNISGRIVRWGFQEVTQSNTADPDAPLKLNPEIWVYTPTNPRSRFPKSYIPQYGEVTDPAYHVLPDGLFALRYQWRALQVGVDSEAGWLAVANGKTQHAFVERFRFVPGADYPDQCTLEFWLNGPERAMQLDSAAPAPADPRTTPYYLETEIISPYITLRPGEEGSFETEWFAARSPRPVVHVTDAGVTSAPLSVRREGGAVRLAGTFGVFYPGTVTISLKGGGGEELKVIPMGQVAPDEILKIDQALEIPPATRRISLELRDAQGRDRGELANLVVERE
jgi:hypothetical protein